VFIHDPSLRLQAPSLTARKETPMDDLRAAKRREEDEEWDDDDFDEEDEDDIDDEEDDDEWDVDE